MVKCADCGMMAARDKQSVESKVIEATRTARESGYIKHGKTRTSPAHLFCFANSESFSEEIRGIRNANTAYREIHTRELSKEISCDRFIPYMEGRTAAEHEQMNLVEQINRLHEQHRKEDIARQDKHEERVEQRFDAKMKVYEKHHRMSLLVTFLVAVIGGIVSLVAAKLLPFWTLPQ